MGNRACYRALGRPVGVSDIVTLVDRSTRTNLAITAHQVRVIAADGSQIGIHSRHAALTMAQEAGLDLVEVQPNAEPPVCRIVDFGRYRFEAQKKAQDARKSQRRHSVKEIQLRPSIQKADREVKVRHVREFLSAGDRVRIVVRFKGREVSHPELGRSLLDEVVADLPAGTVVEQAPRLEGKQMVLVVRV